jgi:ABC-type lipoprotein release transport system permease subunit
MIRALALAARGLARAPGRSLGLIALTCSGFLAVAMVRAGYADMFDRIRSGYARSEGDFTLVLSKGSGLSLGEYRRLKPRIAALGPFSAVRASVPIEGLIGLGERSAPASGLAIEDSGLEGDTAGRPIEAQLGEGLARTLGAAPGDELSALLGDSGYDLALAGAVKTGAATLDRFFVRMPLEQLEDGDPSPCVDRIRVWLADPGRPLAGAIAGLRSLPELSGYEARAYELGNTEVNSVVDVYEGSFRVVLAAVAATLLLALGNATLISSWERGAEWGTMLALGAGFPRVASTLVLESALIGAAASAAGCLIALASSAAVNLLGGLAFPPPPTQVEPIIVRFKPEAGSLALASALAMACSLIAALVAALGIGRRTVVELLFERN